MNSEVIGKVELMIQNMNEQFATQILNWKYKPPYDFYNGDSKNMEESIEELLDGSYYALVNTDNELFGFFCTGKSAQVPAGQLVGAYKENLVDLGLGMNPLFVGQKKGAQFCSLIISWIEQQHGNKPLRLTVATFNQRAIHLYKKLGFKKEREFRTERAEFISMVRHGEYPAK